MENPSSDKPANAEDAVVKQENEPEEDNFKWFDIDLDCEQAHMIEDPSTVEEEEEEDDEELSFPSDKDSDLYRKLEQGLRTFLDDATMECLFGHAEQNEDAAILKETLLRIVFNFPKSALFNDFTVTEVGETETIVCQNLQKRIQSWKQFHFGVPQKIGREYQLGWWRITDPTQLRSLIELYNCNAARESKLQKHLEKHLNYAMQSCKVSASNLEVNDYDRELSECREHGAPTQNRCPHKECLIKGYCLEVTANKDVQVLEVIEAFEEKILSASMQIRSWKPSALMTSAEFKVKMTSYTNVSKNGKGSKNSKKQKALMAAAAAAAAERNSLENAENGIYSENTSFSNGNSDESGEDDILTVQKDKLLEVEMSIERRYLKPPLGFKNSSSLANQSQSTSSEMANGDDSAEYSPHEENVPVGLTRWRDAVMASSCSSQVAMCLHYLENNIAWDKSVMRANTIDKVCIVCGKKGKLLNCDTCAKAFHPNCVDPPMNKQLKGRWVCHLCQRKNKRFSGPSKSASKKSSTSNANNSSSTIVCDDRPTDSPSSTPNNKESKRISNGNGKEKSEKPKKERKVKPTKEDKAGKEKEDDKSRVETSEEVVPEVNTELEKCRQLLEGMMSNESSWPFLDPVNTKQFPTYKKIIKRPIDLAVIKGKFDTSSYKRKEDFALDIRLMFDNCVLFNEDESPVGQAGYDLRAFFETKWEEYFGVSLAN